MTGLFEEPEGATPLDPADASGLRQTWIATRQDLNIAERDNILSGLAWAQRRPNRDYLTHAFARRLHREMFGEVWSWAGTLRTRETNIGVLPHLIPMQLKSVLDDAQYWIEKATYDPDEIAVRLHHRMVLVHPFANGNGRHTRLMADLVAQQLRRQPFTWGRDNLGDAGATRSRYIACLKQADDHDINPLLAFARS